jgi:hypothetical protein
MEGRPSPVHHPDTIEIVTFQSIVPRVESGPGLLEVGHPDVPGQDRVQRLAKGGGVPAGRDVHCGHLAGGVDPPIRPPGADDHTPCSGEPGERGLEFPLDGGVHRLHLPAVVPRAVVVEEKAESGQTVGRHAGKLEGGGGMSSEIVDLHAPFWQVAPPECLPRCP